MNRKKVGLALGGGVVRGLAHAGVLSALEQCGISVDYVAGTSAGSLIGAIFCAGVPVPQIAEVAINLHWWHIARPALSSRGVLSFEPLSHWLVSRIGDVSFDDLKLPYTVVATDIQTGQPVKINQGRLAPAVRASCSIPGFVTPLEWNGRLLVDGSISDTLPVDALREMGADYVIGVDIFTPAIRKRWGPLGWGFGAIEILLQRAGGGVDEADCLIAPRLQGRTYLRFSKQKEYFDLGVLAAMEKIECIQAALG